MENGLGFWLDYESSNVTLWSHGYGQCGGNFTTPNGFFTSPSYPSNYYGNADCIYTISQPVGNVILLTFFTMDMEDYGCGYDFLEIRDGITNDYR